MEQYLIDTNAVSDYFANAFPLKGMQFMDTVIDAVPNLSVMTQIELLCCYYCGDSSFSWINID